MIHSKITRETSRSRGQFWTPDWIADVMTAYVLQEKPAQLLDPAMGAGAFFHAAKRYARSHGFDLSLSGRDVDYEMVLAAKKSGLSDADLQNVEIRDFISDPPPDCFPAIIANPPYIRHHRLSPGQKEHLRNFARQTLGEPIDGRAGLHVYFLLRALLSLAPGGRLAFIVSADVCEGVFANTLWRWILSRYKLDGVITFSADAAPFPDVDTNAMVFLIHNASPVNDFPWVHCSSRDSGELLRFVNHQFHGNAGIQVHHRTRAEALETGLSRFPVRQSPGGHTLGDFATTMRGIATGNNQFFFMTAARAKKLGIPGSLLVNAVGRVRDITGELLTPDDLVRLEKSGRPTQLLSITGSPAQLPESVRRYLKSGEQIGLPDKALIGTRNPWYRMETRKIPPILFAYLGRRNARFIRNHANAVPLTCLLCVYPRFSYPEFIDHLWNVLSHPATVQNLRIIGKSYGGGAIKVEPRALERLPLPDMLVQKEGLSTYLAPNQYRMAIG